MYKLSNNMNAIIYFRKFDLQLESSLKRTSCKKIVGPRHGTFRLHPDLTKDDFEEVLEKKIV